MGGVMCLKGACAPQVLWEFWYGSISFLCNYALRVRNLFVCCILFLCDWIWLWSGCLRLGLGPCFLSKPPSQKNIVLMTHLYPVCQLKEEHILAVLFCVPGSRAHTLLAFLLWSIFHWELHFGAMFGNDYGSGDTTYKEASNAHASLETTTIETGGDWLQHTCVLEQYTCSQIIGWVYKLECLSIKTNFSVL